MPIDIECRARCRQAYQQCRSEIERRGGDGDARNACQAELDRCQDACAVQPPSEEKILICAQNTCQMRKKSLFDMNNSDVQKRIASCSGKAEGAACKPFEPTPDDRLACYNNKCTPKSKIPGTAPGKYSYTACDGKSEGDDCGGREPCGPDKPCPEGQKCVDGVCVVTKMYCCKKCENGKAVKWQSSKPCAEQGFVTCDDPLECGDDDDDGENPCKEGGHPAQVVDGKQIKPCDEGYITKKNSEGKLWCCKTGKGNCGDQPNPDEWCVLQFGEGYSCIGGECKHGGDDPYIENPCSGGHHMKSGTSQCDEGYFLKTYERESGAKENWCCPEGGNGKKACEGGYKKPEGEPCMSGFHTEAFEEVPWCCPDKEEEEGEEFEWSKELKELLEMLMGRFKGLLGYESPDVMGKLGPVLDPMMKRMQYLYDYPRGLTPEERQEVINYAMKGMQRGERGELQSMKDRLSRMGLAGSKFELREAGRIGRETKESEADVRAQLAIDELDRRFKEIMGTTGMAAQLGQVPIELEKWDAERMFNELLGTTGAAQGLMGTFMGAETMPETLSAARRSEGYGSLDMLIRYLATMMGGQQSFLGPYMQAIMGQKTRSGSEGISNWLPYLMMMFQ